jgi:hypothetical protein
MLNSNINKHYFWKAYTAHKDRNMVYVGGYTRQTEILEVRDKRNKVLGHAMGK